MKLLHSFRVYRRIFLQLIVFQLFVSVIIVSLTRRLANNNEDNTETLKNDKTVSRRSVTDNLSLPVLLTDRYFITLEGSGLVCFIPGTDFKRTIEDTKAKSCHCIQGYYGADCGIPDAVWHSQYHLVANEAKLSRRKYQRRIINGLPVLKEKDLLEARVHDLASVVDVFLIGEANYSAHGDPKPLYVKEALDKGFLKEFHEKILHIFVGFFPEEGRTNNFYADEYLREYLGKLAFPQIGGIRDDDLFVINDADEIPTRAVLLFLKLYDGYTEPIALTLRWTVFGFFWKNREEDLVSQITELSQEKKLSLYSVATMGLVRDVMRGDVFLIRKQRVLSEAPHSLLLELYKAKHPGAFEAWNIGSLGHYAGWHCSWCFSPADMVIKMDAAQAGDPPRWGNYPEKKNHTYIESLISQGRWFDDKPKLYRASMDEYMYAPPFVLANSRRMAYMLYPPSTLRKLKKRPRKDVQLLKKT